MDATSMRIKPVGVMMFPRINAFVSEVFKVVEKL